MEINMAGAQIGVQDRPDGGKLIVVVDRSGIVVHIPLDEPAAKTIGAALTTGLLIASSPLKSNGKVS